MPINIKRLIPFIFILLISLFVMWKIIFSTFGLITSFSFWLDDWPLIWGVSQQKNIFFDPEEVFWNFEDERFAVREGYIQIWATSILFHLFDINPYWYHLFGLLAKFFASISLVWMGWKLTGKFYIGIIAGLIFASVPLGGESLYWYNVNSAYILIGLAAISISYFIAEIERNNKLLILSLAIAGLGIYLYPPRSHVFLALPILALLWIRNFFSKKFLIILVSILVVIFISYKLPAGGGAENQAYNAVIHRLIVFGGDGFNANNHIFLTYPFVAISLSIFPPAFLHLLYTFPEKPILEIGDIAKASFYTWNFLFFPIIWIGLMAILYTFKKLFQEKIVLNQFLFWISLGGLFFISNELLRRFFLYSRFWDAPTHFLFTLSIICILFPITSMFLIKHSTWRLYCKILISCIILIISSYILNWAFDPLIHPGSGSISRYLTLPTAFGSIYYAVLFGLVLIFVQQLYIAFKNAKTTKKKILYQQASLLIIIFALFSVYQSISTNMSVGKSIIEKELLPIRSHQNVSNILNKISQDIAKGPKPAVVLLDSWNYSEIFAILLYSGHSLAVWNKINDINQFPKVYYDEKKLADELPELCKKFNLSKENFYRFKVEIDKATNISNQFPALSCIKVVTNNSKPL